MQREILTLSSFLCPLSLSPLSPSYHLTSLCVRSLCNYAFDTWQLIEPRKCHVNTLLAFHFRSVPLQCPLALVPSLSVSLLSLSSALLGPHNELAFLDNASVAYTISFGVSLRRSEFNKSNASTRVQSESNWSPGHTHIMRWHATSIYAALHAHACVSVAVSAVVSVAVSVAAACIYSCCCICICVCVKSV